MSMARLVVTAVLVEGRSKAEVARDYGISARWVHELVRRYETEGEAGLVPRSRRPRSNPRQTPRELEDEIVTLRKQLTDAGLDAGAATIAAHLHNRHGTTPAVSTIWRILTRRGFVTPQPRKRPRSAYIRFAADQPNERWQADTTHWHLADDTDIEILNILDDHSRLLVSSTCRTTFKAADVVADFADAFAHHGLPASILTDNGAIFAGAPRGHGRVAFEKQADALHIRIIHSRAYHPQTCGKVERLHQTLKKWLTAHDPATTLTGLQDLLDQFAHVYNHHRVRHDIVDKSGCVTLRHDSRLHHIGIGKAHKGTPIVLLIAGLHIRIIATDSGELLRELTLDPSRDYQSRGLIPGTQTPANATMSRDR